MSDEFGYLNPVIDELKRKAEENSVKFHKSASEAIQNYLLHQRVRELSEELKSVVADGIGVRAIKKTMEEDRVWIVDRGTVQRVIDCLCPMPFRSCSGAAFTILEDAVGLTNDLDILLDPDENSDR